MFYVSMYDESGNFLATVKWENKKAPKQLVLVFDEYRKEQRVVVYDRDKTDTD